MASGIRKSVIREKDFTALVDKVIGDPTFAKALKGDPAKTLEQEGFKLTAAEKKALSNRQIYDSEALMKIPTVRPVVRVLTKGTQPVVQVAVSVLTKGKTPVGAERLVPGRKGRSKKARR